jgi:hypothetical protein
MTRIQSDKDFRTELVRLSAGQQRRLGKRFVESVIDLCDNPRVGRAITVADNDIASAAELAESFNSAKSAAIESYTLCGREADWLKQASHFVAAAAAACLAPAEQSEKGAGLAWTTAMNARMAAMCANIARGRDDDNSEAEKQYRMLERFLQES